MLTVRGLTWLELFWPTAHWVAARYLARRLPPAPPISGQVRARLERVNNAPSQENQGTKWKLVFWLGYILCKMDWTCYKSFVDVKLRNYRAGLTLAAENGQNTFQFFYFLSIFFELMRCQTHLNPASLPSWNECNWKTSPHCFCLENGE